MKTHKKKMSREGSYRSMKIDQGKRYEDSDYDNADEDFMKRMNERWTKDENQGHDISSQDANSEIVLTTKGDLLSTRLQRPKNKRRMKENEGMLKANSAQEGSIDIDKSFTSSHRSATKSKSENRTQNEGDTLSKAEDTKSQAMNTTVMEEKPPK